MLWAQSIVYLKASQELLIGLGVFALGPQTLGIQVGGSCNVSVVRGFINGTRKNFSEQITDRGITLDSKYGHGTKKGFKTYQAVSYFPSLAETFAT